MEYTVASAAVRDRVGLNASESTAISDPAVQRVRERVDFAVTDDFHYDSHEAYVTIETIDAAYHHQKNP